MLTRKALLGARQPRCQSRAAAFLRHVPPQSGPDRSFPPPTAMCPHTPMYLSAALLRHVPRQSGEDRFFLFVLSTMCVLILLMSTRRVPHQKARKVSSYHLLYMRPRTAISVCYICVLIPLICLQRVQRGTDRRVLMLLCMRPHTAISVPSYYYICALIRLYVSSYYYICVRILPHI